MIDITYFFRHSSAGFSIEKAFRPIVTEVSKSSNIKYIHVPYRRADLLSVFRNILFVYRNRNKTGVNHITGDIHYCILGLFGCKTVLTIHDASQIDTAKNPVKRFLITWLWFKLPVFFADKVVCISEYTRLKLMKLVGRRDIDVIHNALDPGFTSSPESFQTNSPRVLVVGTGWNKNIINTIRALAQLSCSVTFIGRLDREHYNQLNLSTVSYKEKYDLTDEDIILEYRNCDIVCFCSIYEGFGMPIIEGNAVGRIVITSRIAPLTEVGQDAVVYADPRDFSSIKNAIESILDNGRLREQLICNGYKNIERFRPYVIASKYLDVYRSCNLK